MGSAASMACVCINRMTVAGNPDSNRFWRAAPRFLLGNTGHCCEHGLCVHLSRECCRQSGFKPVLHALLPAFGWASPVTVASMAVDVQVPLAVAARASAWHIGVQG
jgi:hypothetical protein